MGSGLLESSPASVRRAGWSGVAVENIPDIVIRRLPIYVRTLKTLCDRDVSSASSEQLAEMIGVTAAQIRRDLSYFGKFGKQGKGYDTHLLVEAISSILKLDRQWPVVLAGLGNLGRAIANYRGFSPSDLRIPPLAPVDHRVAPGPARRRVGSPRTQCEGHRGHHPLHGRGDRHA